MKDRGDLIKVSVIWNWRKTLLALWFKPNGRPAQVLEVRWGVCVGGAKLVGQLGSIFKEGHSTKRLSVLPGSMLMAFANVQS
jgi:hypothetical protein